MASSPQTEGPKTAPASPDDAGLRTVHLLPGRLELCSDACLIVTILGSCVAVCLWDTRRKAGGMNHFLLPIAPNESDSSPRFAVPAIEELIGGLVRAGSRQGDLQAKIFGGARVLRTSAPSARDLGSRNVEEAEQVLARHRIPVVARDIGGDRGRKLLFRTDVGLAWVKYL